MFRPLIVWTIYMVKTDRWHHPDAGAKRESANKLNLRHIMQYISKSVFFFLESFHVWASLPFSPSSPPWSPAAPSLGALPPLSASDTLSLLKRLLQLSQCPTHNAPPRRAGLYLWHACRPVETTVHSQEAEPLGALTRWVAKWLPLPYSARQENMTDGTLLRYKAFFSI